ncbi:transmembrane 4 L6 family member 4-like [Xiphias gladius]|uniref:transmembrane 4 L6 family member 4-like n=1 Tax=Xiphias gladius TaxID=8245 RepID=UPI001A986544|nr:transmembrane 4 L6 family member 4-like [Xiphias gladius]
MCEIYGGTRRRGFNGVGPSSLQPLDWTTGVLWESLRAVAASALYSFYVAVPGLGYGPLCKVSETWTTPFKNSNWTYLTDFKSWKKCTEPKNVVQFNIRLFITLMATSCLQLILCAIQMINGLFGCLCGTCSDKEFLVRRALIVCTHPKC